MNTENSLCYPKQGYLHRLCTYTAINQPGHLHFTSLILSQKVNISNKDIINMLLSTFHSIPTSSLLWVNLLLLFCKDHKVGKIDSEDFYCFPWSLTRTGHQDRQIRIYIRATVYSLVYLTCVHWAQLITRSWIKDRVFLQTLLIAITQEFLLALPASQAFLELSASYLQFPGFRTLLMTLTSPALIL